MILQTSGNRQVVYVPDIDRAYAGIGEQLGLCDRNGNPAHHGGVRKETYVTDCGAPVQSWHLVGQTVDLHVLPSRVNLKGDSAEELCKALNSFDRPRYDFGKYVFTGKFSMNLYKDHASHTISDKMGRKMSLYREAIKDFPGIFNLMGHLGDNNGALFHPVIARYMWGVWHVTFRKKEPLKYHPIGYLDLHEYLCIMRDERKDMFTHQHSKALINVQFSDRPYVEVTGIDRETGQAMLSIGNSVVIDMEKERSFKPYVLVSTKPVDIRDDLKFHWSKVDFDGHSVFLIPVMVCPQSFVNGLRMVDLLAPKQI